MELHQLTCFMAVVEEGGFNRATARLHMTQPALSYQIKQLENELGASLFYRRPRGVSPTEAGRVLFQHAQEILEAVRRARNAIERLSEGVGGEIRIGTVNSIGIYFLPDVLQRMRELFPEARPTVLYRNSDEIMEALLQNRIDLALVANPRTDRRLVQEPVVTERVSLVCGRPHPFFGRKSVKPSELKGMAFVSLTPETPTGALIRDHLAKMGITVDTVVSTDNVETVKKMVEVGLGLGFLPDMVTRNDVVCGDQTAGKLCRIDVGPMITRKIVLVTWKQFEVSRAAAAFMDLMREFSREWRSCLDREELLSRERNLLPREEPPS